MDEQVDRAIERGQEVQKQSSDLLAGRTMIRVVVQSIGTMSGSKSGQTAYADDPEDVQGLLDWVASEVDGIVKAKNG